MEISKTKLALYSRLGNKKVRQKYGLFSVEGEKCVVDMLGAFGLECVVATQNWLARNAGCLKASPAQILQASPKDIGKMSNLSTPPDVIAIMKLPMRDDSPQLLPPRGLSLLIDGVQDPGNLGTIIRTADWFGFHKIYASESTVDVFNPKTIQATMGSLKRVEVAYCNLPRLIERSGVTNVVGTLLDGENIYGASLPENGVIVMGNEGNGISEELRSLVNTPLLIPPYNSQNHAESLNVAVATGIVLSIFRKNPL